MISPLLANLYLNRLDHEVNERCECKPVMVRYADNFVILCRRGQGNALLGRLKTWLGRRGLTLNEQKTRLVNIRREGIKFLGFQLGQRRGRGPKPAHVEPHRAQEAARGRAHRLLERRTLGQPEEEVIGGLNRTLKGWAGYFRFRNYTHTFEKAQFYVRRKSRTLAVEAAPRSPR